MRLPAVARFWLLVSLVFACFVGCKSSCDGVEVNGRCETACKDELCATGFRCFDNACSAPCSVDDDCSGGRACKNTVSDHGTTGKLCVFTDATRPGNDGTSGACTRSSDCAERFGYACVAGACTLTCELHSQCGSIGSCTGTAKDVEKRAVRTCEKDAFSRAKGQFGTACPNGDECDADSGFTCVSAGAGDIDAYCTQQFCAADSECPSGFFCSESRSDATPCEDACGIQGKQADGCVASSDIGDLSKGKHYACGAVSLTSRTCLVRAFCNECDTDADCLGKANQICAKNEAGDKVCTVLCDSNINSCPWGSASVCGLWDEGLGKETCTHRFGACKGTGLGCEPCVQQSDCPNGFCTETQFTGERYCVDLSVSCSCPEGTKNSCTGGGCPKTPAGTPLICLGGSAYKDSPVIGKCVGAVTDASSTSSPEGCWPSQ